MFLSKNDGQKIFLRGKYGQNVLFFWLISDFNSISHARAFGDRLQIALVPSDPFCFFKDVTGYYNSYRGTSVGIQTFTNLSIDDLNYFVW